jgi:hypothetical protein
MRPNLNARIAFARYFANVCSYREHLGLVVILYVLMILMFALGENFFSSRCFDIERDYNFNNTEKSIVEIVRNAPGYQLVLSVSSNFEARNCMGDF